MKKISALALLLTLPLHLAPLRAQEPALEQAAPTAGPDVRFEATAVSAGQSVFGFSGFVSSWQKNAALPVPVERNIPVSFVLPAVNQPGTFRVFRRSFNLTFGQELASAELAVYAICPQNGVVENGVCKTRYFQVQLELSGAVNAFCSASLNGADAIPFPVMTCAGRSAADSRTKFGITLHRDKL
jgi:hypothetical protein